MFRILIFLQKILVVNKCFKTVKLVKKYFLIFHQLWRKREKRGENLFKAILIIRISHANIPLAYILPPSPSSSYLGPLYNIYIKTIGSKHLLSDFMNWYKLVNGSFRQSNTQFLPSQEGISCTKEYLRPYCLIYILSIYNVISRHSINCG